MTGESLENNDSATGAETNQESQQETRYYTQEEFDKHMAGMRKALETKFEKRFAELGDIDELKQLKSQAEKQRQEEALKRGEFEKVLKELAEKKDAEIQARDRELMEYKINTPLMDAAARYRAVNPQQVRSLLQSNLRMGESGVEVVDETGSVRYSDSGNPMNVDQLVQEFLSQNPHFVASGPSTTNSKSSTGTEMGSAEFDVTKLDFKNPSHRKQYKEAKDKGLI